MARCYQPPIAERHKHPRKKSLDTQAIAILVVLSAQIVNITAICLYTVKELT